MDLYRELHIIQLARGTGSPTDGECRRAQITRFWDQHSDWNPRQMHALKEFCGRGALSAESQEVLFGLVLEWICLGGKLNLDALQRSDELVPVLHLSPPLDSRYVCLNILIPSEPSSGDSVENARPHFLDAGFGLDEGSGESHLLGGLRLGPSQSAASRGKSPLVLDQVGGLPCQCLSYASFWKSPQVLAAELLTWWERL